MFNKIKSWAKRHKVWAAVILLLLIAAPFSSNSSTTTRTEDKKEESVATQPDPQKEAERLAQKAIADKLVVTNTINKKVGNKFRYFMDIKNGDSQPANAVVTITFISKDDSFKSDIDFTLENLQPELHDTGFHELNTGMTSDYGSSGIGKFKYSVKIGENTFEYPEQPITDKFEDLSSL